LHFAKSGGLALSAAILSIFSYAVMLLPVYDYSKETMRGGKSELTIDNPTENKSKGGLDKDYAFNWSYGITETYTLLVPRMYGGSSGTVINGETRSEFGEGTQSAASIAEKTGMGEEQANNFAQGLPAYWGPQPNTSGPVYFGAVVLVAFIFGLVFYRGWHKGWIIAATIFGILLAWGKSFSALNYFLFDYLPLYNKFRAPSMALVIPQLTMVLMGALGLQSVLEQTWEPAVYLKKWKNALFATGAVAFIAGVLYFSLNYKLLQ
jgi:hypothetical protein